MGCKCNVVEIILAIVILIFAFWQVAYSQWLIVIAAVLLIIHAFMCKNCKSCETPMAKKK